MPKGRKVIAIIGATVLLAASMNSAVADIVSNLLVNPGFENNLTGWTGQGSVVTSPVHSGSKALQLTSSSAAIRTAVQRVSVTAGTAYEASGWIRVSGVGGGASLRVRWRNAAGTIETETVGTTSGTADWELLGPVPLSAPDTATQADIVLRVEIEADNAGQAWFDDLEFGPRQAQTNLPPDFVQDVVISGLVAPTDFAFLPDGRILIAEHRGVVRIYDDGALSTFLDISSRVNNFGERGLIGIAVDPAFTPTTNNYVYLYYVFENDAANPDAPKTVRLSRFTVSGSTANAGSEQVLVGTRSVGSCNDLPAGADCIPSDAGDHHGGTIRFASDGTIFLSTGDGARACCVTDNSLRAQDLNSLAGKLLHVTKAGAGVSSNPFWNGDASSNRSKIWAYGFRNPFRFSLRPGNDRPFVGDVGWSDWEEIDVGVAGGNYGWPCYEGSQRQPGYEPKPTCQTLYSQGTSAVEMPEIMYGHAGGQASVTGGVFHTGTSFPAPYQGAYFFGDYALGWIRYARFDASHNLVSGPTNFATGADGPVDIEVGPGGSLMYLSINTGELRRIRYSPGNQPPTANASATPTSGIAPLTVQFSSSGSSDPDGDPLTYSWNFGDGSASTNPSPQHQYTANGTYQAVLTVSDGNGGQDTDSVTITVGNTPPDASIDQPPATFRYAVGDTVNLVGSAVDAQDGSLPGNRLSWNITMQHCPGGACHTHPFLSATGTNVSFVVPDHGDDTTFGVTLTATDSGGLTDTATTTLLPRTVQIRLESVPTGLNLVYDGQSVTAPFSRQTVVNSTHTIHAPSPQGTATFVSWSDGGAQQHDIVMGSTNRTFTATFQTSNPTSNLLQNPGFENDLTGWKGGTAVTSPVHSGSKSNQIDGRSAGARISWQDVAVTAGETYNAHGWIKIADLVGGASIRIQWRNSAFTVLRTDRIGSVLTGTVDWTQRSSSVTAPTGAAIARVQLRVQAEADNAGQAWFDDLSFARS